MLYKSERLSVLWIATLCVFFVCGKPVAAFSQNAWKDFNYRENCVFGTITENHRNDSVLLQLDPLCAAVSGGTLLLRFGKYSNYDTLGLTEGMRIFVFLYPHSAQNTVYPSDIKLADKNDSLHYFGRNYHLNTVYKAFIDFKKHADQLMHEFRMGQAESGLQAWFCSQSEFHLKLMQAHEDTYYTDQQVKIKGNEYAIANARMNYLYVGLDNELQITTSAAPHGSLYASISKGEITKNGNTYIANVHKPGKVTICIYNRADELTCIGCKQFRVKRVPDPIAMLSNRLSGGRIGREFLLRQNELLCGFQQFYYDLLFTVASFKLEIVTEGQVADKTLSSDSRYITAEMKQAFVSIPLGAKLYFTDIKAEAPDGSIRDLGTIFFKLIK